MKRPCSPKWLLALAAAAAVGVFPPTGFAEDAAAQKESSQQQQQDGAQQAASDQAGNQQKGNQQKENQQPGGKQSGDQQAANKNNQGGDESASAAESQAQIGQEAQAVLDKVRQAYSDLQSLKLEGKISTNVDVAGQPQKSEQTFTASFQQPNKFRHELKDILLIGSSEKGVFAFNNRANSFLMADPADPKVPLKDLPQPIPAILMQQNPSLFMAVEKNPLSGWTESIRSVEKAEDVKIGDTAHPALKLTSQSGVHFTMLLDPKTHLIRRITADLKPAFEQQGAPDVKAAEFVIDYTTTETGAKFDENHFAFLPPQGAQDLNQERQAAAQQQDSLVGKPAPDFKLHTLDGRMVTLSEFKGQVVLLDFWASWCPPCRESLPHLGKMYGQKDDGVKVLAVNMGEGAVQVQAFADAQNLKIPILLDKDSSVAQKYNVNSIPQSVVIGKDGTVQRVFVGLGPDTFSEIRQTIASLKSGDGGTGEAVTAGAKESASDRQNADQKSDGQKSGEQKEGQQQPEKQAN